MTTLVLVSAHVVLGGTDISSYCKSVTLDIKVDELDDTTFSGGGWHSRVGGLKDGSVKLELNDDFTATTGLDAVLWGYLGLVKTLTVKATSSANSTANPEYQGSVLVSQLSPVAGAVGAIAGQSLTFPASGAFTRATS